MLGNSSRDMCPHRIPAIKSELPHHTFLEVSMKRNIWFLLFGFLLISCAPPQQDPAQARKAIEEINARMAKDMLAGTMDTVLADYTDDAVSLPNNGPMLKGKKALVDHAKEMMAMGMKFSNVKFTTMDVKVSGATAYEIGTYAMTFAMPQMGEISEEGKYLTVYEQAKDGSWKIKVETWNTNKPPPMPKAGS
jgi:uncharacterized protein (TIGR02246 family)